MECCGKRERGKQAFSLNVCRLWNGRSSEYLQDVGETEKREDEQGQKETQTAVLKYRSVLPITGQEPGETSKNRGNLEEFLDPIYMNKSCKTLYEEKPEF